MIRVVLFDVDGVILIGEKFSFQYERDFGLKKGVMSEFFTGAFQDCKRGIKDLKKELHPYLPKWKWNKSVEEFLDYWFTVEIKLNRPLLLEIRELQKNDVVCDLATNQEKYRLRFLKSDVRFDKIFDKIFCSCEIGFLKPEQDFFQAIFDELDVEKQEILFWDSDEENVDTVRFLEPKTLTSLLNLARISSFN